MLKQLKALLADENTPLVVVWNGHFKNGTSPYADNSLSRGLENFYRLAKYRADRFTEPFATKEMHDVQCPYCGQRLNVQFDGHMFIVVGEKCIHPDGLPVTEFELNVPSGRIVVANDLRNWFPTNHDFDINTINGCHLQTVAFSEAGFACGFVGNSCPCVYFDGERYRIGSFSEEGQKSLGERVAYVCTDLWWYSIADEAELKKRFAHYTPETDFEEKSKDYFDIVTVKPGVYRFRHYNERKTGAGENEGRLYAEFEWVRELDVVEDWLEKDKKLNYTALECCIQLAVNSPTICFPTRREHEHSDYDYEDRLSWLELNHEQKVQVITQGANLFLCVIGAGFDWHPNGFPRMTISPEVSRWAKDFGEYTIQRAPDNDWYPISAGYGGLSEGVGMTRNGTLTKKHVRLNKSFVLLALNVLRCMILSPAKPELYRYVYPPVYLRETAKEKLNLALTLYRAYRKVYSKTVLDVEFDAWVSGKTVRDDVSVSDYVSNFDFGPRHPPKEQWPDVPPMVKLAQSGGFVEFDTAKVTGSGFCLHPKNPGVAGCWVNRETAQRYALEYSEGEKTIDDLLCWSQHAGKSVPLRFVARVVGWSGNHLGPNLMIEFDYGTDLMTGENKLQWSINAQDIKAIRHFTDPKEYAQCLQEARAYYEEQEAIIQMKRDEQ